MPHLSPPAPFPSPSPHPHPSPYPTTPAPPCHPRPIPFNPFRTIALLWLSLIVIPLSACRTIAPLPPADLSLPGWNIRRGQAVWRSSHNSVQLAGELVYASNPDGQILIEFTKTPLPLVVVRITPSAWQLEFIAENHRFTGPGQPPPRSAWLVLAQCLNHHPSPSDWIFSIDAAHNWTLGNPRTGEQLDGYLLP